MGRKPVSIFIFQALLSVSFLTSASANPDSVVVPGDLRITGDGSGLVFPDGSIQYKAEAQGPTGLSGQNGLNSLMTLTDESAGSNCTNGGVKVSVGLDLNANGALDSNEITQTKFVCNGSGSGSGTNTIVDPASSLMWQKADYGVKQNWYDAAAYCNGTNFGGYTGWRLPTKDELISLNYSTIYPQIEGTHFALINGIYYGSYWSSTGYDSQQAYHVFLKPNGSAEGYADKTGYTNLVRCVRP